MADNKKAKTNKEKKKNLFYIKCIMCPFSSL